MWKMKGRWLSGCNISEKKWRQSPGTWYRWQWHLSVKSSCTVSRCPSKVLWWVPKAEHPGLGLWKSTPLRNKKQRPYVITCTKDFSACADVWICVFVLLPFKGRDFVNHSLNRETQSGGQSSAQIIIKELWNFFQTENTTWMEISHKTLN